MQKANFKTKAAGIFKNYPAQTEVHFTKDGQGFFNRNDAANHGRSIAKEQAEEKPVIVTVTRDEATAEAPVVNLPGKDAGATTGETPGGETGTTGDQNAGTTADNQQSATTADAGGEAEKPADKAPAKAPAKAPSKAAAKKSGK